MIVQKIFPGVFVPMTLARKDPSVVKRMAANQGLIKRLAHLSRGHVHGERLRQL